MYVRCVAQLMADISAAIIVIVPTQNRLLMHAMPMML